MKYEKGIIFLLIKQLLNSETQLELSLLQALFVHRVWMTTQELQQECNRSRNTIIKYCDILKDEAEKLAKADLIYHEKGKGYLFNGTKEDYQELLISIIHKSLSFDLLQQLLIKNKLSLNDFADEHYTDPMTIRRMLKKFNRHTKAVGLTFQIANGYIRISGSELTIRYFTYTFFWYIYKGTVWPFQSLSEPQLTAFISHTFSKYANINDVITHQWCYILAINIIRNATGCPVSWDMLPEFSEDLVHAAFSTSDQFDGEKFVREINQIYKLPDDEITYFLLLILTGVRIYTIEDIYSRTLAFHQSSGTLIHEKVSAILSYFPEFTYAEKENQKLAISLLMGALLNIILFPTYILPITGYDYQEYLDDHFPFLKEEMFDRLQQMQKTDDFFVSSQDFLLLRLAEMYTLLGNPVDFDPTIVLRLETDLPVTLEKLMKTRLLSLFSPFYHLAITTSIGNAQEASPDLIVSSTRTKNQTKQGVPIVYINPRFTNSDLKDLTNAFNRLIAEQKRNLP